MRAWWPTETHRTYTNNIIKTFIITSLKINIASPCGATGARTNVRVASFNDFIYTSTHNINIIPIRARVHVCIYSARRRKPMGALIEPTNSAIIHSKRASCALLDINYTPRCAARRHLSPWCVISRVISQEAVYIKKTHKTTKNKVQICI